MLALSTPTPWTSPKQAQSAGKLAGHSFDWLSLKEHKSGKKKNNNRVSLSFWLLDSEGKPKAAGVPPFPTATDRPIPGLGQVGASCKGPGWCRASCFGQCCRDTPCQIPTIHKPRNKSESPNKASSLFELLCCMSAAICPNEYAHLDMAFNSSTFPG